MTGTLTIDPPPVAGCRQASGGGITVTGSWSGTSTLGRLCAQVFEQSAGPNFPQKPYSHHGAAASCAGPPAPSPWSFGLSVPNYVSGNDYTLVLWADWVGSNCYELHTEDFTARDSCGSGSGSGSGTGFGGGGMSAPLAKLMPRSYLLRPCLDAIDAPGPHESVLPAGLWLEQAILLEYERSACTPARPQWRAVVRSLLGGSWVLRVRRVRDRLVGSLTAKELALGGVSTPIVWNAPQWDFFGRNLLRLAGRERSGTVPPILIVEPA